MAYTIVRTDGTVLTTIDDGTVNTTSSPLALPGRNYPGYGQVVDTDFVRGLENFAFTTPPANALRGQLWFNTVDSTLRICPIDGESNANAWFTILTEETVGNISFNNLTIPGNLIANNITCNSAFLGNSIVAQTFSGNVSANFFDTTLTGNTVSNNLYSSNLYAGEGFTTSTGNITGIWTIDGTSGGSGASALILRTGGIEISNIGNLYGIKTDRYMWANGQPVNFGGSYSNAQVANYLPTYIGNVGAPNGATTFNGTALSAGGPLANGTITGNWTLSSGSKLNGLSDIDGANVLGTVANANYAAYAGNITLSTQANITVLGVLSALNVNGVATASRFASNVSNGTAPFVVFSSSRVANLNADLLDGYDSSQTVAANTVVIRDASGNVAANYFIGDGSQLTNIPAGNITGDATQISNGTSNVKVTSSGGAVSINIGGTPNVVYTDTAGVNITGALSVSGNVNLNGPRVNLGSISTIRITGGSPGFVLATDGTGVLNWVSAGSATTAQYVTMPNQSNITSVGTLTSLTVSGNVSGAAFNGSFYGPGTGLTNIPGANVSGTVSNATYAASAGFASNVAYATSAGSATSAGFVTQAAQPGITSLGTLNALNVNGNIQAGGRIAGTFYGSGIGLTGIPGANVTGTVPQAAYANNAGTATTATSAGTATTATTATTAGTANNANYANSAGTAGTATTATRAGTVTTAAQPNITSVGTLSSLNVSGTINGGNILRGGSPVVVVSDFQKGSGYARLPGNILMQWGSFTIYKDYAATISFPVAFSATNSVTVSGGGSTSVDAEENPAVVTNVTLSNFSIWHAQNTTQTAWWVAMGY